MTLLAPINVGGPHRVKGRLDVALRDEERELPLRGSLERRPDGRFRGRLVVYRGRAGGQGHELCHRWWYSRFFG